MCGGYDMWTEKRARAAGPAARIAPGARTYTYWSAHDDLLVNADGFSRIADEDYAVALVDEIEHDGHPESGSPSATGRGVRAVPPPRTSP